MKRKVTNANSGGSASKSVTLKDIATDTGFSVTTISHALKDMPDISDATKAIVLERARRLGYIGNAYASSLRSGVSHTIAVILGDLSNPHFAFMAKEIESRLRQDGYSAFFMNTDEDEEKERKSIVLAMSKKVDGIIICPAQGACSSENIRFIIKSNMPCILIGRYFKDLSISYVVSDDFKGGYLAGRHLIDRGHTKIVFLNTPFQNSSSRERLAGYHEAVKESRLDIETKEVLFDDDGDYLKLLVSDGGRPACTAIVAFNDVIAWDILCRFMPLGITVPNDISVIGFDNLHSYLPLPFPLTSISSSKVAMPWKAVEFLLEKIRNPEIPSYRLTLDVNLIDRNSVKQI